MPLSAHATIALLMLLALAAPASAQPAADPTDLDMDGEPGVAEAPGVAYEQIPSALVGVGSLLIDRFHLDNFDVSGFTNFLAENGWTISEHVTGRINDTTLVGIDVLLVPTSYFSLAAFTAAEVSAIQSFLADGGGLWVLHDNLNPTGVNTLSSAFGVTFKYDYVRDPSNNEGELIWPTIRLLSAHAVTAGVDSYGYYLGDCLAVEEPAQIIARADEDSWSLFCPVGSLPPTMAVWESGGRAVFAGDITPLHPSYYPARLRPEEQLLLQNIANWLLGDPPNATSPASWGSLKRAHISDPK